MAEADAKQAKANLAVPLAVLMLLALAWIIYVYANEPWLETLEQVADWIAKPAIKFSPLQVNGIPQAVLATVEILVLGIISAHALLTNEKDVVIKLLSTLGLGVGLTGLITIILGILGALYQIPLNTAILLLCAGFLPAVFRGRKAQIKPSVSELRKLWLAIVKPCKLSNLKFWLLPCTAIVVIFVLCFYHALLSVVMHWDATVYHAAMAVIMYDNHGIPVIAGPSIGIQMSANFPPLFSALGAFYYVQMGLIEDFYLRAISPVMGVLTVLATYKIGETLAGKRYGLISALLLAMSPLFFRYSIYATSYSTLTFFCTAAVMFLFLAIKKGLNRCWIMCGVFYGFALLTSYLAMYLAPFFLIALIAVFIKNKRCVKVSAKIFLLLVLPALLVGGVWYIRNFVLLGNPVYPNAYTVFGGINIDPLIMETTVNGIKWSATRSLFGGEVALLEKIGILLTFRIHFPAISLLTILGIALVPAQNRKFWLLATWPLILVAFILSGLTWGFPRHIVIAMPGFALLSALPIAKALEHCEKHDRNVEMQIKDSPGKPRSRLRLPRKSDLLRISIAVMLIIAFIFPSLTFCMGGKIFMENLNDQPPYNFLWFLENPNAEKWAALSLSYPEAAAWKWLNEHLKEGEKVATIENRIYYVKNCSNDYFFYLDGWEARQLYNMTDMTAILRYLQSENVQYILDVDWAREHGHFDVLPLTRFLGTPFFPRIPYGGSQKLYKVGPLVNSPITDDSTLPTAINGKGWTAPQLVNGVLAQAVIAGSDSPRFFVATPNLTCVEITYLDAGTDKLSIYLYNQYSETWFEYSFIEKTDTKEWKTHKFLAPINKEGFVEFGLHSYTENFTISRIENKPIEVEGKVSLYALEEKIAAETTPQALMVYLPMLGENETITVKTETFGKKVCIEIFEGVIQPWENSEWWKHRELAVRTPDSIIRGEVNPTLAWRVEKSGLYTLVIVLREEYTEGANVNLQISIGGTRQRVPVEKIREGGAGIRVIVMR